MSMIGQRIGNYQLIRELGAGGMGEVYLAEHEHIHTRIAVKVLFANFSRDDGQVERFFNEARAVASIHHAGIVKIHDVGFTHDRRAYLLMELLDGESLADRIARGRMSHAATCEIARQIASVLAATHDTGIIHRDLKPDNIFLVPDREQPSGERVKVLDFGIAKLTGAIAPRRATLSQSVMGTPLYMSPEQAGDASKVDARSDIYSLGCIVFEMACGRPPFEASTPLEAMSKHVGMPPPLARSLAPDLAPALEAIIGRMLAKAVIDRPQTMHELVGTFAALGTGGPPLVPIDRAITLPGPTRPAPDSMGPLVSDPLTTTRRDRNRTWLWTLLGGVCVAMVIVALGFAGGRGGADHAADIGFDGSVEATRATSVNAGGVVVVSIPEPSPSPDGGEPPALRELRERTEAANPFIVASSKLFLAQRRVVSWQEYSWFLAVLSNADRTAMEPLLEPQPAASSNPVTGVAYEQANRYCAALGAALPSSEQWSALRRSGMVRMGPVKEWTRTPGEVGMVLVRKPNVDDAMQKTTRTDASADQRARVDLGFRCVR